MMTLMYVSFNAELLFKITFINLPQIISTYEELFDQPYALPEMEQIAVPSMESAMEHWGLGRVSKSKF